MVVGRVGDYFHDREERALKRGWFLGYSRWGVEGTCLLRGQGLHMRWASLMRERMVGSLQLLLVLVGLVLVRVELGGEEICVEMVGESIVYL